MGEPYISCVVHPCKAQAKLYVARINAEDHTGYDVCFEHAATIVENIRHRETRADS